MESRKMVPMNLHAGQEQRCRHREETRGHGVGRMGQIESVAPTYTQPTCQLSSEQKTAGITGDPAWCSVMTSWGVVREGREAQKGGSIHIYMTDSHC